MLCSSLTDSAEDQQSLEKVVSACLDVLDPDDKVCRQLKKLCQRFFMNFFMKLLPK